MNEFVIEKGPKVTQEEFRAAMPPSARERLEEAEREYGRKGVLRSVGYHEEGKCPVCRGKTNLYCEQPTENGDFPYIVKCGACEGTGVAGEDARAQHFYTKAGIPIPYRKQLSEFRCPTSGHKKVLETALEWMEGVRSVGKHVSEKGLGLFGPPGTGKTTLACMIGGKLCRTGIQVRFRSWLQFVAELRAAQRNNGAGPDMETLFQDAVIDEGVLVLDDIGASESDWTRELLQRALDLRYYHCMPTIATSNVRSTEEQDVFGEAVASRLRGYFLRLPLGGNDARREPVL